MRPSGERVRAECLGDAATHGVVIDVVHDCGAVRNREARGIEADAPGSAPDDQHRAARAVAQRRDDTAPRVGEVVAGGRNP
jgi:hypothetical protein